MAQAKAKMIKKKIT